MVREITEHPARGKIGEALRRPGLLSLSLLLFSILVIILLAQTPMVGLGPVFVGILILVIAFLRRQGMGWLGFRKPASWLHTHLLALVLGVFLQMFFSLIVDPVLVYLTGEVPDLSAFDSLIGNLPVLLQWLALVWLTIALLEEVVFRGYMMGTMEQVFADNKAAPVIALVLSSVVFGIAHSYQGISGIVGTGLMGAVLGWIYLKTGRNVWLPILVHGWVDTVGLYLIYAGFTRF